MIKTKQLLLILLNSIIFCSFAPNAHSHIQTDTFLAVNMGLIDPSLAILLKSCHQQLFQINPDLFIGLGWRILHSNNNELIYSVGGTYGFRSFIGFNQDMGKGVVILCNSREDWADTTHWVEELGRLLLE